MSYLLLYCTLGYFISDGTPIDNFEFFRYLCEARMRAYPNIVLSLQFMLFVGYLYEKLYLNFKLDPLLTRTEVLKVGNSHYFSIEKAKREVSRCYYYYCMKPSDITNK